MLEGQVLCVLEKVLFLLPVFREVFLFFLWKPRGIARERRASRALAVSTALRNGRMVSLLSL